MLITNLISRYMELCKAAFLFCGGAKLNKSIQSNIMEMLFLLMVIPRKVNFTQMGRYNVVNNVIGRPPNVALTGLR